jgi:hypothetical protein
MKKIVKLTESDLIKIVKKVIIESEEVDDGGLDYIDSHWDKYKKIANKISKDLPDMRTGDENEIGKHLRVKKFSDLDDTWSVKDLYGFSSRLNALADKITHMMFTGKGDSIKPMLKSIVEHGAKTQYRYKNKKGNSELERGSLGKGHFKWDFRTYTLNPKEIKKVKEFFNL